MGAVGDFAEKLLGGLEISRFLRQRHGDLVAVGDEMVIHIAGAEGVMAGAQILLLRLLRPGGVGGGRNRTQSQSANEGEQREDMQGGFHSG